MNTYRFYKERKKWYIDYPKWTGAKWELEMVMGADKMLDIIASSRYNKEVFLIIGLENFTASTAITKIQDTPDIGGATYLLKEWNAVEYNLEMWLCHVTEFIFGYLPEFIYIKQK